MTSQPDGPRHRGSSVPLLGLLMVLALIAAACGSTGEDQQPTADEPATTITTDLQTADEPATTITTDLQTADEPATGEAEAGGGPVTDEIRVAVLVDGEFVGSDGISETTRFRIGSVTKMFTGVVLSQLHADGLIDLDAPISTYLDIDSTVTTRDLLSHTAGLAADPPEDVVFEWAWQDMSEPLPPSTMIELTEFTDDRTMYYSNSGYLYAGQIIEAVTGQDAAEVFAERIYEPLGLTSTCWPSHDPDCETDVPGVMDTIAVGGDGHNALVEEFAAVDSLAHSAGALVSTVEDLNRFVTALFNNQVAGTDEFRASTTDPQYQIPEASIFSAIMSAYGLGVMVFDDGTVGHFSQTIGFMSSVTYNPDTDQSTIVLVNDTTTSTALIVEQVVSTGTAPTADDVVSFR